MAARTPPSVLHALPAPESLLSPHNPTIKHLTLPRPNQVRMICGNQKSPDNGASLGAHHLNLGPSRKLGIPRDVHSILNPKADLVELQRSRKRSASQMELPSSFETQPSNSLPSISRLTSVDSTQGDMMPSRQFQAPGLSAALHPRTSLNLPNPPTGTIDIHKSPSLPPSSRPTGSDPATSQAALPTPPIGPRTTYFPAIPPTAPTPPPGVTRSKLQRRAINVPQSGSAGPIANNSPYSYSVSVASSQCDPSNQQGAFGSLANSHLMQGSRYMPMGAETDCGRIPMQPTAQSSIQIMTIKSQQGHHVQIPVDVQAASKVADEKRKRNAGASAIFRAKRKEKEREASMSISRLEQQLRDSLEDIEYYRNERDYFKSIVFQQPGAERHYARPPSPRLRRLSTAPSNAPSSTTGGGSNSPHSAYDYDEDIRESDRNVRQRTSNYNLAVGCRR